VPSHDAVGTVIMSRLDRVWTFDANGEPQKWVGARVVDPDIMVSPYVLSELNAALADDNSDVRRISSWTIDRTFVYLDISDFSKFSPAREAIVINSLVFTVKDHPLWKGYAAALREKLEAWLCIGDGYIFVFREAVHGAFFAAYLAALIEVLVTKDRLPVEFHFRIGVHIGPVYSFWDPGRKDWNYIGDGINGGQRVLSAVGKEYDDVIYISGEVRERILASISPGFPHPQLLNNMHNRGRKPDKHGNLWRVYEVSHMAVCREWLPRELHE
jgi:class 3 adenylate cyclase